MERINTQKFKIKTFWFETAELNFNYHNFRNGFWAWNFGWLSSNNRWKILNNKTFQKLTKVEVYNIKDESFKLF